MQQFQYIMEMMGIEQLQFNKDDRNTTHMTGIQQWYYNPDNRNTTFVTLHRRLEYNCGHIINMTEIKQFQYNTDTGIQQLQYNTN